MPLTHAWGGTLGITTRRLPLFARVGPQQLTASGYSGHGVALAGFAGQILAETIAGDAERFDLLSQLPTPFLLSPVKALDYKAFGSLFSLPLVLDIGFCTQPYIQRD